MIWIRTIPYRAATGRLRKLYDRIKGPGDNVDNIMMAHALRPHTMEGHMALYKNVLHHNGNELEKSLLELIGVWVSLLNDCHYCVEHHYAGLRRLLGNENKSDAIRSALEHEDISNEIFKSREQAALEYARDLTRSPAQLTSEHIQALRAVGFTDGEVLELNQVTAYFAYANRTVLGLGVSIDGDIIGLSPGNTDDPDDWSHK